MVGVIGGFSALDPILEAGDSVLRPREVIEESVSTVEPETPTENMSESVTVMVT